MVQIIPERLPRPSIELKLQIPPYVARYIQAEYGSGPYQINQTPFRDLSTAFWFWGLRGEINPPRIITTESLVSISLFLYEGNQSKQAEILMQHRGSKYTFFYLEFWAAAAAFTDGFVAAGGTRWQGLIQFLEKYGIEEDLYSIDSAYRMLSRLAKKKGSPESFNIFQADHLKDPDDKTDISPK